MALRPKPPEEGRHSPLFVGYLVITALLCGAFVMVIEVLGSKVLGPLFGVSLFVWTSLITVTLVSLAAGYALGGVVSDKKESPSYLYGIIFAAGVAAVLVPHLRPLVLKACIPLGLRLGSLTAAVALFGPGLFLLGCVSPYIIKIAAREMRNIGRTVGVFYALSTIGSVVGTVLTGFVFIAYFRVDRIFEVVGAALIVLSAAYYLLFRKKWYLFMVVPLTPFLLTPQTPLSKLMSDGTYVKETYAADSFYGKVKVLDYSYEDAHTRELMIDGLIQSILDMNNGMSVLAYPYFTEMLPYVINPSGKRCLVLGLGAGVIPMWFEERGIKTDVVEIDPDVVNVAKRYFGFNIDGRIVLSDARYFLSQKGPTYDYIVVDVASGDITPAHIFSLEAFKLIRGRLANHGVLSINFIGNLHGESFITASVVKTLGEVFKTVKIYPNVPPDKASGVENITLLAYDFPPATVDADQMRNFPVHPYVRDQLARMAGREFVFPEGTSSMVLTDNYNPVDVADVWVKEQMRKGTLYITDLDVIIH